MTATAVRTAAGTSPGAEQFTPAARIVLLPLSTSYADGFHGVPKICPSLLGNECELTPDVVRFAGAAMMLRLSSRGDPGPVWSAAVGAGGYRVKGSDRLELGLQGSAQRTLFGSATGTGIVAGVRTIVVPRTQGATQAALHLTLGVRG